MKKSGNPFYFFSKAGAASALNAASFLESAIKAVVSRGGRADLAKNLEKVKAPTLLIVGSLDTQVINLNEHAYNQLGGEKQIEIISGASHLFEEPGALENVASKAANWFDAHLCRNIAEQPTH